ncbi:hypothetical protein MIDIC_310016 [Alphaproteobacteria bacterium]
MVENLTARVNKIESLQKDLEKHESKIKDYKSDKKMYAIMGQLRDEMR